MEHLIATILSGGKPAMSRTPLHSHLAPNPALTPEAHAALQASEAMNQALLDLSPFPIAITCLADGRFMRVNQRWCKITGFKPEEVIGRTPLEMKIYVNQTDRERMVTLLRQQGLVEKFETRFKTKDGRFIHAHMSAKLIQYQGHECLLGLTTYVDELSKAQQALRESENRFRNILNSITESYYEIDLNGNLRFFNDSFPALFGRSAEELIGINYKSYIVAEDIPKVFEAYHAVYQGRTGVTCVEYGIIRKDGTIVQVETSASLLLDNMNRPIGFYGILRDRTAQKKAEELLRQSVEKYRGILEEMEEGYYELDLNGNFTYFNETTVKNHGYSAEELMGMNYKQILKPEQAQEVPQLAKDIYKSGKSILIRHFEILRKDGSTRLLEISSYPRKDPNGSIIGFWGITRDRTEQRNAEIAIARSEEKHRRILEEMEEGYY
jgi:PAS domain S-box-containing protein